MLYRDITIFCNQLHTYRYIKCIVCKDVAIFYEIVCAFCDISISRHVDILTSNNDIKDVDIYTSLCPFKTSMHYDPWIESCSTHVII